MISPKYESPISANSRVRGGSIADNRVTVWYISPVSLIRLPHCPSVIESSIQYTHSINSISLYLKSNPSNMSNPPDRFSGSKSLFGHFPLSNGRPSRSQKPPTCSDHCIHLSRLTVMMVPSTRTWAEISVLGLFAFSVPCPPFTINSPERL